jgi:alpha-1,3-rhamnosyl/mannosyltransferase
VPGLLVRLHADLYHTPYYVYPYIGLPCPAVVTLHDLIPLRFPRETPWRARLLFDLLHRLAIARATRMITVSTAAQADLVRTYRLKPDRMTVIPHAPGAAFGRQPAEAIAAVRARYDLPERYILSVGTNKPHKNHARLVEAFALIAGQVPDLALVIAGQADPRYRAVQAAVQQAGLAQRVRLLPNVAEADLPALYAGAFAFCLPSLYEGFGLPLVEAMASGAPVICGWQSSMPEVVGPAALLVDVRDPDAIGRAILRLDRDAALAAGLRAAGLQRAAQFSWERAARATLDVYESI